MSIRFNDAGAQVAIRQAMLKAAKQLQGEFLNEAQSHMRTAQGRESLYEGEIRAVGDWIIAEVVGGAWAAMDNYGTGSLMAGPSENPALIAYMQSELWNTYRSEGDTTIRSRNRGEYQNIFGETVHSRSNRGGIDLERKGGKFAPQPPSFALETAARWMMQGRIQQVVQQEMAAIEWHRFVVVDERG